MDIPNEIYYTPADSEQFSDYSCRHRRGIVKDGIYSGNKNERRIEFSTAMICLNRGFLTLFLSLYLLHTSNLIPTKSDLVAIILKLLYLLSHVVQRSTPR